jgi:ABC-type nitrate/sulfonate/bicarbonate transport system substrate-binding protein
MALSAAAALVLATAIAACGGDDDGGGGGGDGGGEATSVRGAILPTATHLPMMVAEDEGIFDKHGVDMKLTVVQNIATLPGAMGRQFDFGSTTLPDVIKAQQQGIDVVITTNVADETSDNAISGVFAGKDSGIDSPQDLVGKKVGVIAIGGNIHTSTLYWLINEGVDHERINFIEVPPPNQLDQLNGGQIDAAENLEPFRTAMTEAGHKLLVDPILEVSDPGTLLSWMSERGWAEENPETVENVVAAIEEAGQFIEQNNRRARDILAKYSGLPPEVARNVKLPVYNTQIADEQVTAWAEMLQAIGELKGAPKDVDPNQIVAIPE